MVVAAETLAAVSLAFAAFLSYWAVLRSESFTFPARHIGLASVVALCWLALPRSSESSHQPGTRTTEPFSALVKNYERIREQRIKRVQADFARVSLMVGDAGSAVSGESQVAGVTERAAGLSQ